MTLVPLVACSTAEFNPRAVGSLGASVLPADDLLAEGRMHFRSGNFALAAGSFRKAMRQAPERPDAYNGLAASYDRLGRFDLAERYYQQALALAPADPSIRTNYAISLRMQGRSGDADRIEAETAAFASGAAAPAELPAAANVTAGASVTIMLPPLAPANPTRLKRMSTGEVALLTSRDSGLAESLRGRALAEARSARLPIAKVRETGREIEWRLDPAPGEARQQSASLRVLNAVGRKGQAARMEHHLREIGWAQTSIGDAERMRDRTIILCAPGQVEEARALARTLPFEASIAVSSGHPQMTLVLGQDAVAFDDRLRSETMRA